MKLLVLFYPEKQREDECETVELYRKLNFEILLHFQFVLLIRIHGEMMSNLRRQSSYCLNTVQNVQIV